MSLLEIWVETPGAIALGWTLAHSLWEGALVALGLAAALCVIRSSRGRYAAACLALLILLAGLGLTFIRLIPEQRVQRVAQASSGTAAPALESPDAHWSLSTNGMDLARYLPWLAPLWIAGVLAFHLRSVASWMAARRLRRIGVCCASSEWQRRLEGLAARLRHSGPVMLLESSLADVPVAIGYLRPVILMPVGLLAGLPAGQIEMILLHELAHIRRHDYLVNLLQVFVEGFVFYHPAVWWISGVIRAEREHCCDDLVVATGGDAYGYATALAALEQNRGAMQQAVLAATGGSLVKRIHRLLAPTEGPRAAMTPVFSAVILTITAIVVMVSWQSRLLAQAQQTPVTGAADSPYIKWINEDVAYIVTNEERVTFQGLHDGPEREQFIEDFWLRRDPTPGTLVNEFKEEHYRRIAYANERFGTAQAAGWKTDRGRIYITLGPPDEIEAHPSGGSYQRPPSEGGGTTTTFPFQKWRYRWIDGIGPDVDMEFVDRAMSGEYRMTSDPSEKDTLASTPGSARRLSPAGPLTGGAGTKAGAAVQSIGIGGAQVSIPLVAYGNHQLSVYGRIRTIRPGVQVIFEESILTPTPVYSKFVSLGAGSFHLDVVVRDMTTGSVATDTIDFEVK